MKLFEKDQLKSTDNPVLNNIAGNIPDSGSSYDNGYSDYLDDYSDYP